MKNFLLILCMAALVACIGIGGWMLSRPNPANAEIARLERELKDAREEITTLKASLETEKSVTRRRTVIAAPSKAPGGTQDAAPAPAAPGSSTAGASASPFGGSGTKAFRDMMQAPGMKEMIKKQNVAQMDMLYGGLFNAFQLNPEERENFKMLLAERASAQTELGLKMMDDTLTPEQKKQLSADYGQAKKTSNDAIRTFLGDEGDFKTFEHWEDTQPERTALEMMGGRAHFATAGDPLTPDQEQRLIDLMSSVRKAPSTLPDMSKPENFWSNTVTDELIQKQLEKVDRDAQTVAQNAAGFLSSVQIEALAKMQKQTRTMTEAGLKMSGAMFKGGK